MEEVSKAIIKYVNISPRKARLIVDMIRGKEVFTALKILKHTNKKGADLVLKALLSAAANAKQKEPNIDIDSLIISKAIVDPGPTKMWRRFRAATMGRAFKYRKHHSHIKIFLAKS